MKTSTLLGCLLALLLTGQFAQAQTKAAAKPAAKPATSAAKPAAPAAKPVAAPAPKPVADAAPASVVAVAAPALITDKMADPTPNTNALKVRAETNPLTKRLTVRTDATGPTRVELNGTDGRPVLTRDLISGDAAAVLDVSNLPAGSYIVQCTSGERRGLKRVMVGQ
ncbi:T9SS type A sorting domain-containing protein [Hymenobacter sp. 102]|uniref:T9SS type A sorting domain-containing protein n=1 Tax=Hymenobacter sp. 102 TaxID=3403152 RepID=UPI003CEA34AF